MGLDWGEKRIGVALSDPEGILATASVVLERRSQSITLQAILDIVQAQEVQEVVVGLPFSLDGILRPQGERIRAFGQTLAARSPVPVVFWDERFSTLGAERLMREAGTRAAKRRERRDAEAAAFMLQGYLDRSRSGRSGQEER